MAFYLKELDRFYLVEYVHVRGQPFPVQGPLHPDEVTGRDELRRDLAERLMQRQVTAMLGPRRYGKTSVLRRVTADLAAVGPETVWIDLYELNSMADLAGAIDHAISGLGGRIRKIIDSISSDLSFRIGSLGVELSRSARERPDPVLAVRALLRKLVEVAEHHDLIVVFDEFSGIANVDRAAGLLRTELQHHYRDIGLIFAGSEPSTMRMLFSDQAQPFFAQADLVEIGPLTDAEIVEIVESGFADTGRNAGVAVRRIVKFVRGHPQRMMQMADAVWRHTNAGETADLDSWDGAALAAVPYFAGLSEADLRRLADSARVERWRKGEPVFHQDDECRGLHVVAAGRIRIFRLSTAGREQVLHTESEGAVGEAPLLDGGPYPASATAADDLVLLFLPHSLVLEWCRKRPEVALGMAAALAGRVRRFAGLAESLALHQVSQRLAAYLVGLAEESRSDEVVLSESNHEIAAQIGTVRELVSRLLGELRRQGLIEVSGRRVTVPDLERLRARSRP